MSDDSSDPQDQEPEVVEDFGPVPPIFQSMERDEPFERCLVCDRWLLDDGTGYLVEKAFSNGETIFEYAMCDVCRLQLRSELSKESLEQIERLFDQRVDLQKRRRNLIAEWGTTVDGWLERCLLSGKPLAQSKEYQIFGYCDGPDLLYFSLPYGISGEEIENVEKCLSKKTRDRLDDFVGDFLGLPSDGIDLPILV